MENVQRENFCGGSQKDFIHTIESVKRLIPIVDQV